MSKIIEKLENFAPHLISAALIFIIGYISTRLVLKLMAKGLNLRHVDTTIHKFLMSIVHVLMLTIVVVMSLSALQVPMSSIITTIGAAGLAIGLALQNSLSNVAGGFIILFSKPFKCGDYVSIDGEEGTVESISILYTRLLTIDNKSICIPNGNAAKTTIINFTAEKSRRLELKFSIGYNDDHHKAMDIIKEIISDENRVQHTPDEPMVAMCEQGESGIILIARFWIPTENYWEIRFKTIERVKEEFDKNGITIPFNQIEIHNNN